MGPKQINPAMELSSCAPTIEEEAALLRQEQAGAMFLGEQELASSITRYSPGALRAHQGGGLGRGLGPVIRLDLTGR